MFVIFNTSLILSAASILPVLPSSICKRITLVSLATKFKLSRHKVILDVHQTCLLHINHIPKCNMILLKSALDLFA